MVQSSFVDLIRNPVIIIPSILLLLFSLILSQISYRINNALTNNTSLIITIWLILFTLVFFLAFSYFYSGLIYAGFLSINKKVKLKEIFQGSNKYWMKNFFAILLIIISYSIVNNIVAALAFFIGKYLGLPLQTATFFFYFLYFLGLVGFTVFLTFTSFFLIRNNHSLYKSIKESISFTARNYIATILTLFIFFIITEVLTLLDNLVSWPYFTPSELLCYLVIYPLLVLILARLVDTFE